MPMQDREREAGKDTEKAEESEMTDRGEERGRKKGERGAGEHKHECIFVTKN